MTSVAPIEPADGGLRARILVAATRLFAERGYNATSVREVVAQAGCTKPALYYYFASKEALFHEALRTAMEGFTDQIEGTMRVGGSTREQLLQGTRDFFAMLESSSAGIRLLLRAELQPDEGQPPFDFVSFRTLHFDMLKAILRAGVDRGDLRHDVDLEDAAYALAGIVDQRVRLWLTGQPAPPDVAERLIRVFFDGVG